MSITQQDIKPTEVFDVYRLGSLFIFEISSGLLWIFIVTSIMCLAAIGMGIYAVSQWKEGKTYEETTDSDVKYDIAFYVLSGFGISLVFALFITLLVNYFRRNKSYDEEILKKKWSTLQAGVLQNKFGEKVKESLPGIFDSVNGELERKSQKAVEDVTLRVTNPETTKKGEIEQPKEPEIPPTYEQSERKTVPAYTKVAGRSEGNQGSPISLSRASRRRKSPSSLKKKKASLKKKKPSPTKKKSTSSKRK